MSDEPTEVIPPMQPRNETDPTPEVHYGTVLVGAEPLSWEDRWFIFALRLALLIGVVGLEIVVILAAARLLLR